MTVKNAFKHIKTVFKERPMNLRQFEDDVMVYFDKNFIEKGVMIPFEARRHKGKTQYRVNMKEPFVHKTRWYDYQCLAVYETAIYHIHNNLEAFKEFYNYPDEQAMQIIKEGFND